MKIPKIFGCFPQTNDNEVTQAFYLWVSHNFCSYATNLELKDVPFYLILAWACASSTRGLEVMGTSHHMRLSTTTNDIFILRFQNGLSKS